jgi:DNA-binding response OmpR family regulator
MRVLIGEDDPIHRLLLKGALAEWGYEVVTAADGNEAWAALERPDAAKLAVLDWIMPGLDGPEICRRLRARPTQEPTYVLLLTVREGKENVVAGLRSGADDFLTKPCDRAELQARLAVGCRVVALQASLAARVRELEDALTQVTQLDALLPICSYCKKVRDDQNYWKQVETYIAERAGTRFSHGICPECLPTARAKYEQASRDRPADRPGR